ncbi:MAG: formylglycine-generating enzyme family protein [Candidatus Cloacimonetes bacterium]|jgi:formylglycine-generating enzyme required for sulfatase activity|nr:formylglycine-generating enzyme family protein [Candidatus Cloacimonadota bacterium]NLO43965.1 formylglycine-generating enzyme family protein [Candidatus Cloacimonadota bacterium]
MRKTVYLFVVMLLACLVLQAQSVDNQNMVFVEGGSFMMGCDEGLFHERPSHEVSLSSFWIGKYEVTQAEWKQIMEFNPSGFTGDMLPANNISWYMATEFCNKLSLKEGLSPCYSGSGVDIICDFAADGYRLPTEAEWEYAARGGKQSEGYKYAGSDSAEEVAWFSNNAEDQIYPVGQKKPNELGLYDMHGNVSEWCWDWYNSSYYEDSPKHNPQGESSGGYRVIRGGSWNSEDIDNSVSSRDNSFPEMESSTAGFRLVRSAN